MFLIRGSVISKWYLLFILRMTQEKDITPKLMAGSKSQKTDSSMNMHHCLFFVFKWVLILWREVETILRNSIEPFTLRIQSEWFISLPPQNSWIIMNPGRGKDRNRHFQYLPEGFTHTHIHTHTQVWKSFWINLM